MRLTTRHRIEHQGSLVTWLCQRNEKYSVNRRAFREEIVETLITSAACEIVPVIGQDEQVAISATLHPELEGRI